jgi:hypothetical protein
VRWSDDMPVYKTTTLTAKWVDLGEYFKFDDNEMSMQLVKKYPYSILQIPQTYNGHLIQQYVAPLNNEMSYASKIEYVLCESDLMVFANECFKNDTNLLGMVSFGKYISVDESAFEGCTNLATLSILNDACHDDSSNSVIANRAFASCNSLESIELQYFFIDTEAFVDCSSLKFVYLYNNTDIETSAFKNDSEIQTLYIQNDIDQTSISEKAFDQCKLEKATLKLKNIEMFNNTFEGAFVDDTTSKGITIDGDNVSLSEEAFKNCTGITSINFTGKVDKLDGFVGCSRLKTVTANETSSIESGAFDGCTSLTTVTVTQGLKKIYGDAFTGCNALKLLVIDSSLENIDVNSFAANTSNSTYLTGITIYVNGKLTFPIELFSKGLAYVYNHVSSYDLNYSNFSLISWRHDNYIDTTILSSPTSMLYSTLADLFGSLEYNKIGNMYTLRITLDSNFYSGSNYKTINSNDFLALPDETYGVKTGSFSAASFSDTKYFYVGSGLTYAEANSFTKNDVVITPQETIPSSWDANMSGDSTKANIITDIDVGRDQMQYCFFNHNVVKTSLTLIEPVFSRKPYFKVLNLCF